MTPLSLVRKAHRSIKRRGWRGTASLAWTMFRRSRVGRLHLYLGEVAYDMVHGVRTRGIVRHENVGAFEYALRYEATRRSRLRESLDAVPGRAADLSFVDIGCGRGLVLLLAAERGYRRVIGVELSSELCEAAEQNARRYRPRRAKRSAIEVQNADATAWDLPPEPLVVYVANSFARPAFDAFAANVSASLRAHPRELFLIYMFPESRPAVDAIAELEVAAETPHYVLYRSVEAHRR